MRRLFGWLFAIAAIAVIVFAVLNYGNYTSMCFDEHEQTTVVQKEPTAPSSEAEACDAQLSELSEESYSAADSLLNAEADSKVLDRDTLSD